MAFVDFKNVWLAYNDELMAQNQFAVEDINLSVTGDGYGRGLLDRLISQLGSGSLSGLKLDPMWVLLL